MQKFGVIIFDLDSTLVKLEGLDWLAGQTGKGNRLRPLTIKSMNGELDFHQAMVVKMRAISPSYSDLVKLGKKYCDSVVKDAREVIDVLHHLGKQVWLLTGNFQPAVGILGKFLGIPDKRIICNKISNSPRVSCKLSYCYCIPFMCYWIKYSIASVSRYKVCI